VATAAPAAAFFMNERRCIVSPFFKCFESEAVAPSALCVQV
jgi:hypothetical protein